MPRLARETGVQDKTRTFSPWSHLLALMSAQLTRSIGLNDVCDALALHSGPQILRGLAPQAELLEAAKLAFNAITPADCLGFFLHSCYAI